MANREADLNTFNQRLRANPQYRAFLTSIGVNPDAPMQMSDQQRKRAEQWVRANVADIGDLEIDPAGNVNQNEGFGKQLAKWGPIAGGAAATLFGIPGLFPGLLSGGSAGATGAATGAAFDSAPNIASAAGMANATALGGAPSLSSALGAVPAVFDAAPNIASAAGMAGASSLPGAPSLSAALGAAPAGAGLATALTRGADTASAVGQAASPGNGLLDNILTGLRDYGPLALGGLAAARGLTQGATQAEQDLSRVLSAAMRRVDATEPLFNQLNRMVTAQMPSYTREGS